MNSRLNRSHALVAAFACAAIAAAITGWRNHVLEGAAVTDPGLPEVEVLEQTDLGGVTVQAPGPAPKGLVLLITGSTGEDAPLNTLAHDIAAQDYVVAIIDSSAPALQKMGSTADANDVIARLLALSSSLETRYHIAGKRPVIIGYESGATRVYQLLAQAPANLFHAGISLDFCPAASPTQDTAALQPVAHLDTVWFVFQQAPACNADIAARFVQHVDNARLNSTVANREDDANSPNPWPQLLSILQWLDPRLVDQLQADEKMTGVPLIEIPAEQYRPGGRMAVLLSGDGGWAELDRTVAETLAGLGIRVVGWDSLSYFWRAKTPEQAGQDLERVLQHYQAIWQPGSISLIGYSFGANVLPFMASRLSADWHARIDRIVLISPEARASFEFHVSDWLGSARKNTLPLRPEFSRLRWTEVLCVYGDAEQASACPGFAAQGVSVLSLEGDHHFDGKYENLARQIIQG